MISSSVRMSFWKYQLRFCISLDVGVVGGGDVRIWFPTPRECFDSRCIQNFEGSTDLEDDHVGGIWYEKFGYLRKRPSWTEF